MKKVWITLLLLVVMILPTHVFADEVKSENLDEILTSKSITHDFSNYSENDDQAIVYLFYGQSCGYCQKFIEFLNGIIPEYGKYFKVVGYEVWSNSANADLMDKAAKILDESADGVPFIIIGDQVFTGYSSSYDDKLKSAIKSLYDTKKEDRYDILKEIENGDSKKESGSSSVAVIIWNFVFVAVAAVTILVVANNQNKALVAKVESLEAQIANLNKKEEPKETKKTKTSKK